MIRNISFFLIIFSFLCLGCSSGRTASPTTSTATVSDRPCIAHFTNSGGFWQGQDYRTYEDFPHVSKNAAFERVGAAIASDGFQIVNSNKDAGIISASQPVSGSRKSKTVPINAIVTRGPSGGSRVELVITLSTGLVTSADAWQTKFCKYLAAVSNQSSRVRKDKADQEDMTIRKEANNSTSRFLIVIKKSTKVRTEVGKKGKVIATLKKGDKVQKLDAIKSWYKVELPSGDVGWVSRSSMRDTE